MVIKKGQGQVIGDYIHARYMNYKRYGITYKNPAGKISPNEAFKQQRAALKRDYETRSNISDAEIENLETYYNVLFSMEQNMVLGLTESEAQQIKAEVISKIQKKINNSISQNLFVVDENRLNVNKTIQTSGPSAIKKTFGESFTSVEKIEKILNSVLAQREKICSNKNSGYDIIKKQFNELDILINQLSAEREKLFKKGLDSSLVFMKNPKKYGITTYTKIQIPKGSTLEKLLSLLTTLHQEIIGTTLAEQMGLVGEYFLPMFQEALANYANEHIELFTNDMVKKFLANNISIVGTDRSAKVVVSKNILGGDNFKYQPKEYVEKIGDTEFSISNKTQDKVDLIISYNDKPLNISIKNYNPNTVATYGVHLLSGKNLLTYLQNYTNFTNHYLNITAAHTMNGDESPPPHILQDARNTMKLTLAVMGLAGGAMTLSNNTISQQKKAQLFIINKQAGGRANFEIYRVDDIISRINKNKQWILLGSQTDINKTWKNEWQKEKTAPPSYRDAYLRSLRILEQMRHYKLDISLAKNVFNKG